MLLAGLQHFVADFKHLLHGHVACNAESHIVEIIKGVVAVVELFGGDFRDRLDRTCDVDFNRVVMVHILEHIEHHAPVGRIVVHLDFLTDNALLLCHGFRSEVRVLNKVEQNLKALLEPVGAGKEIAGLFKAGVGVCGSAGFCVTREGVALLALEELVLKVVGYAVGNGDFFSAVNRKAGVYTAVVRADNGVCRAVALLGVNVNC